MAHTTAERRVPAIVISGFLGAGKTTVVRWLLADARARGQRVAVVSNEFGALGIDRALLGEGSAEIVELDGGCVCCQLSNDLRDTIVRLHQAVDPDLFVVEASGLALASETLLTFWREPVRGWISDDIGVVVVNAAQVLEGRDLSGTFEDQLGSADLIVLNQVDLVAAGELDRIEAVLRQIEPQAPIVRVTHGQLDPTVLVPRFEYAERESQRSSASQARHSHDQFRSEILEIAPASTAAEVAARLQALAPVRAKGFIATPDGPRLLQLVGARVELSVPPAAVPAHLLGRVVVVRRVDRVAAAAIVD